MRQRGHQHRPRGRCWLWLGMLAFVVPLLAACGSAGGGATGSATSTAASAGSTAATSAAPATATTIATGAATTVPAAGSGTVRAIPLDGYGLSGQDRVGAAGMGAFLFFDAAG
ncbi:MAG: hypothetical protein M3Q65_14270 [Chloroflexota bacterium]|nr:hypothetical protein [Chloroflexota bacterium]